MFETATFCSISAKVIVARMRLVSGDLISAGQLPIRLRRLLNAIPGILLSAIFPTGRAGVKLQQQIAFSRGGLKAEG